MTATRSPRIQRVLVVAAAMGAATGCDGPAPERAPESLEIAFPTATGVSVVADHHTLPDPHGLIILFHQGGGSAVGEYGFLLPTLLAMGFEVVAADLHGGGDRFGAPNRTMERWPEPDDFHYCDALTQVQAVLEGVRERRPELPLTLWGSSYSGALVLHAAAADSRGIDRVLAFSPASGEPMVGCQADDTAERLSVPVLVVRPIQETELPTVQAQLERFAAAGHATWIADPGAHGSSTLNPERVGADVGATWERVRTFLTTDGSAPGS